MNKKIQFSLIVPVYNSSKYLQELLNSIIKQTYTNFEVIIINDGSTDISLDICKEYEKKDYRFKVYSYENAGLSEARNRGVKLSKGKYIIFIDSDDLISPFLLQKIYEKICLTNSQVIKVSAIFVPLISIDSVFEENHFEIPELSNIRGIDALEIFLDKNVFFSTAWGYAINRNFYTKNKLSFATGKLYEDFRFVPELLLKCKDISTISDVCYFYIERKNSICTNHDLEYEYKKALDFIEHYDYLKELIMKLDMSEKVYLKFNNYLNNRMISRLKYLKQDFKINYIKMLKDRNIL